MPDFSALLVIIGCAFAILIVLALMRYGATHLRPDETGLKFPLNFPKLDFQGHLEEGNRLYLEYHYQESLQHYIQASRLKPKETKLHFRIGRLYQTLGQDEHALTAFHKVLARMPQNTEALYEIARIYLKHKNIQNALKYINLLLKIQPQHTQGIKLKIKIFIDSHQFEFAEHLIQQVLAQEPNHLEMISLLAWCQQKMGQWHEAIATLRAGLYVDPLDRKNFKYQIYLMYENEGLLNEAIDCLQEIIFSGTGTKDAHSLENELARCWCAKGIQQMNGGNLEEAILCFQKALEINSNCSEAFMGLGRCYKGLQQWEAAIQNYQQSIKFDSNNFTLYMEIGALYEQLNQYEEAIAYMEQAEMIAPLAKVFYYLGTLHGMKGDLDNCILYLNKALRKDPKFVDAYYNLGVALEQQAELKEAANAYRRVLSLDKNHSEAQANLDYLERKMPHH